MPQHTCREGNDPRHKGYCPCGLRLHEGLKRDREFERRLVREATAGLMIDPEPMIVFAQRRADHFERDYGHDFPSLDRDMAQETLDELGDACNYIAWYLDAIRREWVEGGDRVTHLQTALKHVALAFDEVQRAR